jgi:hypothetical protein
MAIAFTAGAAPGPAAAGATADAAAAPGSGSCSLQLLQLLQLPGPHIPQLRQQQHMQCTAGVCLQMCSASAA